MMIPANKISLRVFRMLFKVVVRAELMLEGFIVAFRNAHADIVQIAAHQQHIDLVSVHLYDLLFADQPVAEVNHVHAVLLAVIGIFREQPPVMRKRMLQRKNRVRKASVQRPIQFVQPLLHQKIMFHQFSP